jgi:hypothetical protein
LRLPVAQVRKLFESNHSRDVAVDDDGNRRVSFEKFRAVLKVFRTPGQPFATWPDITDLHGLCDNGNISTFFKVAAKTKHARVCVCVCLCFSSSSPFRVRPVAPTIYLS